MIHCVSFGVQPIGAQFYDKMYHFLDIGALVVYLVSMITLEVQVAQQDLRIRLVELLAEKSKRDGELYTIADVENATGIERRRLYQFRDRKVKAIKPEEIQALCDYFPCEVGELVYYVSPLEEGQEYVRLPLAAVA